MTAAYVEARAVTGTRWADYLQLTRPRLCVMALMTVTAGAALTFLIYVFVYTPLNCRTPLNTLVGAIPGALPP